MHFNKKYPWDGVDVMSKFTGREVWIYPDVDGIDVMKLFLCGRGLGNRDADGADVMTLFYAREVWEIPTPHPVMITRQTPKFGGFSGALEVWVSVRILNSVKYAAQAATLRFLLAAYPIQTSPEPA